MGREVSAKKIKDCILPEDTKKTFSEFLKQGEIPNLLLSEAQQVQVRLLLLVHCVKN